MASVHLEPLAAASEIKELTDRIFLDDSLQGWTPATLHKSASKPGALRIREDIECPPGNQPIDLGNAASGGFIVLGYYRAHPRQIILFPAAIRMVAALPDFASLNNDHELLFHSVLLHEIGHWLTLHPQTHRARIGRCQPPSGEAETLTEILNWITLTQAVRDGTPGSKQLLRCQHLKRSRGPTWQYQAYPLWLMAGGHITEPSRQLPGIDPGDLSRGYRWLAGWLEADEPEPSYGTTCAHIKGTTFPGTSKLRSWLPYFSNPDPELAVHIDRVLDAWQKIEGDARPDLLNASDIEMLDI